MVDPQSLEHAVVVGMGSNLAGAWPSREALLESALARLRAAGLRLVARSSWWISKAWPDPAYPDFVNGVGVFESEASPEEVLLILLSVENEFGRIRGTANAPRTLDLDLVAHGRTVLSQRGLILPHPRAHDRLFVMGPLAEAAPSWRHPTLGVTAKALAEQARVGNDARPLPVAALHKKA